MAERVLAQVQALQQPSVETDGVKAPVAASSACASNLPTDAPAPALTSAPAGSAATPAGSLLCQRDSYAKELLTTVVSCAALPKAQAPKKKKKKGKGNEAPTPTAPEPLFEVVLQDTVLFPEGGGQPYDHGVINDDVLVTKVENRGGVAVHSVTHELAAGQEVRVRLDWDRRWDNMQQHSAQHLITALAIKLYGVQTDAWNLGEELSFIDLDTPALSPDQVAALEATANGSIRDGLAVAPRWISPADPEMQTIRCRGLPDDVTGDVRVLEIAGLDKNLCCGTHVQTTGDLQCVKLLKAEKAKKQTRLWFVAGDRVMRQLGATFDRQTQLTTALSIAPEQHVEQIERLGKAARDNEKQAKALQAEVATLLAEGLKAQIAAGAKLVHAHRDAGDIDFMRSLTNAVDPQAALLLVTAGTGAGDAGMFMLSGPEEQVKAHGPTLAKIMEGRGGGKGRFQGKVAKLSKRADAVAELTKLLAAA